MSLQKYLMPALVGLFLAFLLVSSMVGVYADWLWFGEVDFEQIFLRTLGTRVVLGAGAFVARVYGAVCQRAARPALHGAGANSRFTARKGQPHRRLRHGQLKPLFLIGSLIAAGLLAFYAAAQWDVWLMSRNAVAFGMQRPDSWPRCRLLHLSPAIAPRAAEFRPFDHAARGAGRWELRTSRARTSCWIPGKGIQMSAGARRHLSVLAAFLLLLLAVRAWLGLSQLLVSPSGIVHGASYVDVNAGIPVQWALVVVAIARRGSGTVANAYRTLLAVAGSGWRLFCGRESAGQAYGIALQRLVVAPNEQVSEVPYISAFDRGHAHRLCTGQRRGTPAVR